MAAASSHFGLKSPNAIKMQNMLNSSNTSVENGAIICLKIGPDDTFYVDFSQGKGKHIIRDLLRFWHCIDNAIAQPGIISEVISGRVDITVTLADQATFDSLLKGTSQSEFLQAYLTGDISVDGDMDALIQLQKLLPIPNMQSS